MVRISDIAAAAGVSRPTASLILLGKGARYAEGTRKNVLAAAEALGYKPNILADSFRQQRSFLIGVLCNGVNYDHNSDLQHAIQADLINRGIAPLTLTHRNDLGEEAACLQACLDRMVEGVVVNAAVDAAGHTNVDLFVELAQSGMPVVEFFGRYISGVPFVHYDYEAYGRMAAEELIKRGHRRIALFTHEAYRASEHSPGLYWSAWDVWKGYASAMTAAGLKPFVVTRRLERDGADPKARAASAAGGVEAVLTSPYEPTALVCLGEEAKVVLIRNDGVRRIAAAMLEGTASFQGGGSEILVFHAPAEEVGRRAAEMVCDLTDGKPVESCTLPPTLE